METLLILAALAVAALVLAVAAVMTARERRPPLQMQREIDLADGDEDELIRSLQPAPRSPIDRSAPILDAEWRDVTLIDAKRLAAEMADAKTVDTETVEAGFGDDRTDRSTGALHGPPTPRDEPKKR